MGITASGPVAGGLAATIQSAAMGGPTLPLVAPVLGVASVVAMPIVASVLTMNEYNDAQSHQMGHVNGLLSPCAYHTVVHNYGSVEIRSFESMEAALESLSHGRNLRRFAVRRFLSGEADHDNGHGWRLPWVETGHAGYFPVLDNKMRQALLNSI